MALLAGVLRADDEPRLDLNLSFSADNGKTWSADFPMLEQPGVLKLRVTWANPRPAGETEIYTTALWSEQTDYASATSGHQDHSNSRGWHQRPPKSYAGAKATAFDYTLDLRARPEGVMGRNNLRDRKTGQTSSGPLPACPALSNGTYKFTVTVGYNLKLAKPPRRVEGAADFFVSIGLPAAAGAKPASKAKSIAAAAYDAPLVELGAPDFAFDAAAAETTGPRASAGTPGAALARITGGEELSWRLKDVPAGRYHAGVVLSSAPGKLSTPRCYVDGSPVLFDTTRKPGQVENRWVAEYLTDGPITVGPGSEFRVLRFGDPGPTLVGRLALYRAPQERGPIDTRPPAYRVEDKLRLSGSIVWTNRGAQATAQYSVTNVLPRPVTVTLHAKVLDYFQQTAAERTETVTLQPRQSHQGALPFAWGDSHRYRLVFTATTPDGLAEDVVIDALADAAEPVRGLLWLSGREWDFTGLGAATQLTPPAPKATWERAWVPGRSPNSVARQEPCGWFRTTFEVPAWMAGTRRHLVIQRALYEATVVLNGREVGKHMGWQSGFEIDVTAALRPGKNELLIGLRDGLAAFTPEEQAKGGVFEWTRKYLWPGPSERAGLGDVRLVSRPAAGIGTVTVRTSYRNRQLEVLTDLDPQAAAAAGGTLRHTVYFEGRDVLKCPAVAAAPGTVRVVQAWPDPILWGARQPNLLRLESELLDKDGRRVDLVRTRFGFRELWPEGRRLMLNGKPINLRSFAMNDDSRMTENMQVGDIRSRARIAHTVQGMMERHITAWDTHFDVADEEGLLVARSVTGEAGATQWKLESDVLWRNTETLATEAVRFFRNHPCLVEWYISNEYSEASSDPVLATRRLADVARAVKAADPTRIVEAGCDLDLRGALDIISTHYPVDIGGLRDRGTYLPDSALWYLRGQSLTNGMRVPAGLCKRVANVHGESPFAWGLKPILINETGWNVFYAPPFGFTVLAGDEVFRSPEMAERLHEEANRWFMAGHRDAEASVITPWHHHRSGVIARVLPPLDLFPFSRIGQWYEGADVAWTVDVFHDTGKAETLTFHWALESEGRTLRRGRRRIDFPAYGLTRETVSFPVPRAWRARDRRAELRFSLMDDAGTVRLERRFPAAIYTKQKAGLAAGSRVGLYDPDGITGVALQRLGVKTQAVGSLNPQTLAGLDLLVIGEQAAAGITNPAARQATLAYVEQGGALLCLRQDDLEAGWLPVGRPVAGQVASAVYLRAPHHPALAGLTPGDLTFWTPDHIVAQAAYPKAAGGNTTTLLDCGNAMTGLDLAVVQETRMGKGRVVCSQLMFADRAGACPPADRLMARLMAYLTGPAPAEPAAPVLALVESGSALDGTLTRLGAELQKLAAPEALKAATRAVVADARYAWTQPWVGAVAAYLTNGGTVLLHGAGPAQRDLIGNLSGRNVRLTDPVAQGFAGRMILYPRDRIVDGLNSQDFFWRRQPETENFAASYTAKDFLVEDLAVCAYEGEGVDPLGYPAALAKIKVGRGLLILDGVRWDDAGPTVRRNADRIAGALLGNLGVRFTPKAAPGRLTGLTYATIDLRGHLNRGLADPVPEDGQGGWTDQGPDADMRALPTGRQVMAGVPFDIATPLSCVVLASRYRTAGAPEAVTGIKVGRRAHALYFLQSAAWAGRGLHATYRLHYADGTTADILLEGGINYRDWASRSFSDPFALETGTFTQVGWTGASKVFPKVSVYVMEWRNPRPDVAIETLDFLSANNGVPVLVAVTAGEKPPEAAVAKGDPARAAQLDEEARAARQTGNKARALELAHQAVAADATYVLARVRLGDLLEENGKLSDAEAQFRRVVELQPDHLETYLRIGRICEVQKRWADALAIYRRSLEVNVNQPPVMQALERVKPLATRP
jgi:hypothetical protein